MIRFKKNIRLRLMAVHGFAMVGLGLGLFYVRSTMTNALFEVIGGAFAMLLVAGSLLFIAVADWLYALGLSRHQTTRLRGLLILSTAAAACSVFLVLYPGASIRMLCYALAVYAFSLSLGKLSLAKSWHGSRREKAIMYVLAGVALAFSADLLIVALQEDRDSLAVIATYSLFMGFQMLLTMYFFLQQREQKPIESVSELNQASV